jgi:hypothetical protein
LPYNVQKIQAEGVILPAWKILAVPACRKKKDNRGRNLMDMNIKERFMGLWKRYFDGAR